MPLSKKDVVTLALAEVGGATAIVDTEDVAISAHALAPRAFGWRKHTEQIDLDTVRVSLRHEAESPDPRLAGSVRDGWHLTSHGALWVRDHSNAARGEQPVVTPPKTAERRAETRVAATATGRIRASEAYRQWSAGSPVSPPQAAEVFRIDYYTPERDRHMKIARLAESTNDHEELQRFILEITAQALSLEPPQVRGVSNSPQKGSP